MQSGDDIKGGCVFSPPLINFSLMLRLFRPFVQHIGNIIIKRTHEQILVNRILCLVSNRVWKTIIARNDTE